MNVHPNDRIHALKVAVRLTTENYAEVKVLLELRPLLEQARLERRNG